MRLIEEDGWYLIRTRGSHRQYKHSVKTGVVTIAERESQDLAPGTWHSILIKDTSRLDKPGGTAVKYVIAYEQTDSGWSAYVPDLPGCVAAADKREEIERLIRDAISLHLEAVRESHAAIPQPGTWTEFVEV